MRRPRIALSLAATLGVFALLVGAGVAVLELSPRDYRLVWMLRRTKRLEYSFPWSGSRVIDITEPREVAAIVSAMTAKLDRAPDARMASLPTQLHFFLDDGQDVVAALAVPRVAGPKYAAFVRLPGESIFRCYAASESLGVAVLDATQNRRFRLGTMKVEGRDAVVDLDCSTCSHPTGSSPNFCHECILTVLSQTGEPLPRVPDIPRCTFTRRGGGALRSQTCWRSSADESRFMMPAELDELESVDIRLGSETASFSLKGMRFHDPILPRCPTCGLDEHVVPWVWAWEADFPPPFHGRCKLTDERTDSSPSFFCEKCNASF